MSTTQDIPRTNAEDFATARDIAELSGQIAGLRAQIRALTEIVTEQKARATEFVSKIKLNRRTLESLLEVSKETIFRWCNGTNGMYLINYKDDSGHLYFFLKDVYDAIHTGKVRCRGLNAQVAIERIEKFNEGKLEGFYMSSSKENFMEI